MMTPRARTPVKATARKAAAKPATPRKAAPRKATAKPPVDLVDEVDEVDEVAASIDFTSDSDAETDETTAGRMVDGEGNPIRGAVVPFRGRMIPVQMPDEVQLAVIKMFSDRYANIEVGERVPIKRAISMSSQAILCVQSVMTDEDDQAWIADQLLARNLELTDALEILNKAMELLRIENGIGDNREQRRAAKKAKKARLVTGG